MEDGDVCNNNKCHVVPFERENNGTCSLPKRIETWVVFFASTGTDCKALFEGFLSFLKAFLGVPILLFSRGIIGKISGIKPFERESWS